MHGPDAILSVLNPHDETRESIRQSHVYSLLIPIMGRIPPLPVLLVANISTHTILTSDYSLVPTYLTTATRHPPLATPHARTHSSCQIPAIFSSLRTILPLICVHFLRRLVCFESERLDSGVGSSFFGNHSTPQGLMCQLKR